MSVITRLFLFGWLSLGAWLAQGQSSWRCHLARERTTQVCIGKERIFALADGTLYSIDKRDQTDLILYDKVSGLSDVSIQKMAYAPEAETLLLYYQSGNIDLLTSSGIVSIPTLAQSPQIRQYNLHQILLLGTTAYLAGEFGLARIDLRTQTLQELAPMGKDIEAVAYDTERDRLVILSEGVLSEASRSAILQDPTNWTILPLSEHLPMKQIAYLGSRLLLLSSEGRLYEYQAGNITELTETAGQSFSAMQPHPLGLVLEGQTELTLLRADLSLERFATPAYTSGIVNDAATELWLARGGDGLLRLRPQASPQSLEVKPYFNAPTDNTFFAMRIGQGRLYAVNGGRHTDRFFNAGTIKLYDGKAWTNIRSPAGLQDPIDIIPHRDRNPDHYYVASWGEGLYEMQSDRVVQRFDTDNSALSSAIPGTSNYTRVGSLSYDNAGNLWMAQGLTASSEGGSIVRLSAAGAWNYYRYPLIHASNSFGPMVIFPDGTKWLADYHLAEHGEGITIIKDGGTTETTDDHIAHYNTFRESGGKSVSVSKVYALSLDREGGLWVGSNIGYFSVSNPTANPDPTRPPLISRPTGNEGGVAYYLLDNITVRAIAVDRQNRKWIGTEQDGLYLVSADGRQILNHFRAEDTPLLSNSIQALAYDDQSGWLFISTSLGLNSYNTATGEDLMSSRDQLVVYPNPLRPEHPDLVHIQELSAGATLRVFNMEGQIVHQGEVVGHSYEWYPLDTDGRRLPSGVYQIVLYPLEGKARKASIAILGH